MRTDVAIIGGGPGGATMALYLLREGVRPLIIEKDEFPRYHIGESMTGECGAVLRDLGLESVMQGDGHPQKQGVKVFGAGGRNSWFLPVMRRTESGELADQFTWQVRRSGFDQQLLDEAVRRGATVLRGTATKVLRAADGAVCGVTVERPDGSMLDVASAVLVDASGQRTWLSHQGVTSTKEAGRYDKQIAIFSQVANTLRDNDPSDRSAHFDNTLIFWKERYHWSWFIPLDDQVVSIGVVSPSSRFRDSGESRREYLLRELRELNPEMSRRVPDLTLLEEARAIPNYSFHIRKFSGKGWLCIGDSHRFIDPIFSFGLYVTMKEAQFAAPVIAQHLRGESADQDDPFGAHATRMEQALDILQDLIDGFWGEPQAFAYLVNNPRTRPSLIDLFAGRIYDVEDSPALRELRVLASKARRDGVLWGEDRRGSGFAKVATAS